MLLDRQGYRYVHLPGGLIGPMYRSLKASHASWTWSRETDRESKLLPGCQSLATPMVEVGYFKRFLA